MIPLNSRVRIDLGSYIQAYPDEEHLYKPYNGLEGILIDSWIEVDGDRVYDVDCGVDIGIVGAFGEKDLVLL